MVILPRSTIGVMDDVTIKALEITHSEFLSNLKQIHTSSENFKKRYLVYAPSEAEDLRFLTKEMEQVFLSYYGANFVLVLFPEHLEIRLRDRNVYSQIPPLGFSQSAPICREPTQFLRGSRPL